MISRDYGTANLERGKRKTDSQDIKAGDPGHPPLPFRQGHRETGTHDFLGFLQHVEVVAHKGSPSRSAAREISP